MVTGSAGSEDWAANLEVKCFDLHANPYLMLAGLLAAGAAGLDARHRAARAGRRRPGGAGRGGAGRARHHGGCRPRCGSRSTRSLADEVLTAAFGEPLVAAIRAVRESEIELFDGASPDEVAAASRWAH